MASLVLLDVTPLSGPDNERGTRTYVRGLIGAMRGLPTAERPGLLIGRGMPAPEGFSSSVIARRGVRRTASLTAPADLVHLTAPETDILGVAQVSSCHDLIPLRFPAIELGPGRAAARRRYNGYLERLLWARLVLVPSQATADDLIQLLAIPVQRIRVIPYGAPALAPEFQAAGASRGAPYALIVANREPHTNAALAIRSLAGTNPRHALQLVIVGVDERRRRERLQRLAVALGVQTRTRIIDTPTPTHLSELRARALAALVPSSIDGFSIPALAAMAQGLPVIAREISGLTEALGSAGVLVPECAPGPWAEVLDGLVEDPRWCADLARRSRARAATLTWAETATRTHAAYVEACGD